MKKKIEVEEAIENPTLEKALCGWTLVSACPSNSEKRQVRDIEMNYNSLFVVVGCYSPTLVTQGIKENS